MIDTFHFPIGRGGLNQIFYAAGISSVVTVGSWQVWQKPKGAMMVSILCIGSGASGAGGNSRPAGTSGISAGGGGGGCSGYTKLVIPAYFLPEFLHISVGVGRDGGAANGPGVIGMNSYVSAIRGNITAANLYLSANANNPAAPAAAGSNGTAGAAGTIAAQTAMQLSYPGSWSAVVSIAGGAGGITASAAAAVTAMVNSMLCGGTGGGGTTSNNNNLTAGGAITGAGLITTIPGGLASGGDGNSGFWQFQGLCGTGGTGGGSNPTGSNIGGKGGQGGFGCGGGGGGQGVTGGQGGKAGDGLVIISCW
jgi:hypothetical protein